MTSELRVTDSERQLFDLLPYGVSIQDEYGALVYVNPAAAALMGYASCHLPPKAGANAVLSRFTMRTADGKPLPVSSLPGRIALASGTQSEATIRFREKGTTNDRWSHVIARPIINKDGHVVGVLNTIADTTALEKDRHMSKQVLERENSLRLALDVGNMGLWDWDIPKNSFTWSDGTKPIRTLERGNTKGTLQKFLNHIYAADRPYVKRIILKAKRERGRFEAEFRIIRPDKSIRWMYKKGEVLYDGNGKPVRMIGVGIDITKRKNIEAVLLESRRRFKAIFDSAMDGMIITDHSLRVTEANVAAIKAFAIPLGKIGTMMLPDALDEQNKRQLQRDLTRAIKSGTARNELSCDLKHDGKRIFEYGIRTNFTDGHHLFVFHDITDRVLEEQRREHLLGLASHELKTPIASIKAFIALLYRKTSVNHDKGAIEFVKKIDEKIDAVTRLVNDLLDVSRIRDNRLDLYYEVFPFDPFLKSLIADFQLTVKTHKIHLRGRTGTSIYSDRQRIGQVITNLLKNAVRYSPNANTVLVRVNKIGNRILLHIQDYGIGIQKEEQKRIFGLFYKTGNTSHLRVYGLGVGLYIAKTIVEHHGGTIWVSSTPGEGSTFYISLPIKGLRLKSSKAGLYG